MKTRQLVANDARVVEAVKAGFVAVAASDVEYAEDADPGAWETRWLRGLLRDTPHGLSQGIYLATPSGRFLGRADGGWPEYDPEHTVRALAEATRRYRAMARSERLLDAAPDPERDRGLEPPDDGVKEGFVRLEVSKRTYPFEGMDLADVRHPRHVHLARVDLEGTLVRSLVPADPAPGREAEAAPRLMFALAEACVFQPECSVWRDPELAERRLVARVDAVEGDLVHLTLDGRLVMAAENEWSLGAAYDGRLGGRATWNRRTDRFVSLELVARGAHTLARAARAQRPGAATCDVAVRARLVSGAPETGSTGVR